MSESSDPDRPQYGATVDDVPITGPSGTFDESDRERAIRRGERRLELDVNGGDVILHSHPLISDAVAAYASYLLTLGSRHPDSMTLGTSSDSGEQRQNLADRLLDMYEDYVDRMREENIANVGDDGSPEPVDRVPIHIERV